MNDKIYTRHKLRLPKISSQGLSHKLGRNFGSGFNGNGLENSRKKYLRLFKVIVILVIAYTVAYFSLEAIEPIMKKQCTNMAKSIATKISNNEATQVMKNYKYEDLINTTKDKDGNVKMVETNIVAVNEIISDVPLEIQKEIEKQENSSFSIPLGSFLGSNLFAGRGPKVNIKMELSGNLDTELKSEFVNAGINQTLHKIYLEVKCNIIILTPFETMEEQIVNQILLAEGVIVGNVPNSYYNLEGIHSDNIMDTIQ